jgi:fucose 4-O-acetylase-like acetyltransferase
MKQRIEFIDSLKGFAIFCVLWGHSIQYLRDGQDFFHNQMFEFIYSFHMPLFFLISGFFFCSSLKLQFKEFLKKKAMQLLLPCFVWAVIFILMKISKELIVDHTISAVNYKSMLTTLLVPLWWPFWFLKELFYSYLIVYLSVKICKKEWLAVVLSICFVLFAPLCGSQRFLLPIFWIGFWLKNNYQTILPYSKWILLTFGIILGTCLLFWDGSYTNYVTAFRPFNIRELSFDFSNIDIALFRWLIGITGSIFFFILFQTIYKKNRFFSLLGKTGFYTLGIYILQSTILEYYLNKTINFPFVNIWIYNFFITPLVAFVVLIMCIVIIKLIKKNRYIELLLLGNSYQYNKKHKINQ